MSERWVRGRRAQANPLGVVLLFTTILVVSAAVVVAGTAIVDETQQSSSVESARVTMSQVQSTAADLATNPGSTQRVRVAGAAGEHADVRVDDGGEMTVTITDGTSDVLLEEQYALGRLVIQRGDSEVAYQGGGVWLSAPNSNNSAMVSAPDMQYRYGGDDATMSLPVVSVTGNASGAALALRQAAPVDRRFPNGRVASNPLAPGKSVTVTVRSKYYKAWGEYFAAETNGSVTYDHGNGRVTAAFTSPTPDEPGDVHGALVTSGVSKLTSSNDAGFRSYDSSTGSAPYPDGDRAPVYVDGVYDVQNHVTHAGDLVVANRAEIEGPDSTSDPNVIAGSTVTGGDHLDTDPTVVKNYVRFEGDFSTRDDLHSIAGGSSYTVYEGDVYVGGDLQEFENVYVNGSVYVQGNLKDNTLNPNATIEGDLVVDGTINAQWGGTVKGETRDVTDGATPPAPATPSIPGTGSVAPLVDAKRTELSQSANNDNDRVSNLNAIESWGGCSPTCRLGPGSYYFDERVDLHDEKLVLDARRGPIELYLTAGGSGNSIRLFDSNVTVLGDHGVDVYTEGTIYVEEDGGSGFQSGVYTRPDPKVARNVRVHVAPSGGLNMPSGDPRFTGVINGSGSSGGASISLTKDAAIYGAVVGQLSTVDVRAAIHFDESLLGSSGGDVGSAPARVEYVHVSNRTIEVSG